MDWPPWRVWKLTFRALGLFSDEGLTLETSALKLLTVANLNYQHNWYNQNYHIMITKRRWEQLTCFFATKQSYTTAMTLSICAYSYSTLWISLNKSSEGRADTLFTTSTTPAFCHLLASQCFSSMLVKWNQLRVVNFRQIFFLTPVLNFAIFLQSRNKLK